MDEDKWYYKTKWAVILILVIAAVLFLKNKLIQHKDSVKPDQTVLIQNKNHTSPYEISKPNKNKDYPEAAVEVYEFALANDGQVQAGYKGNTAFMNREGNLPKTDENGNRLKYKEYDVFPLKHGKNRGTHRVVIDNNSVGYYTKDHYNHFIKIQR